MKKGGFFDEFKKFISRGNVMDLAVGMIIGGAFTAIVSSLVDDVVMPLISLLTGGVSFTEWNIVMGAGENAPVLGLGNFVAAIVNFILVALVIFMVIRAINNFQEKMSALSKKEKEEEAPTTKVCPFCKSEIDIAATRCPHCTSEVE